MCVAHRSIDLTDSEFAPVRDSLLKRRQKLVLGGQLRREYLKYREMRRFLLLLDRAGALHFYADAEVDVITSQLTTAGVCSSNDEHLIALARRSGARVLCTSDKAAA